MRKELILVIVISILAVCYAGYRAHTASMTMDESGTFLNHVHKPVFDILTNSPKKKADGNNHILNTLLMKASIAAFGANSLSVRLPNVLALGFYLFFGIRILLLLSSRPFFLLLGMALMLLNPFQFDFFSLGRGYGLGMAFMTASIFYWLSFLLKNNIRALALGFTIAFFSVLSNFVWLNFFAALIGCFSIWFISKWIRMKTIPPKSFPIIVLAACVILISAIYTPLIRLNDIGLFTKGYWGNNDFWTDTFHQLFSEYVYGKTFLSEKFLINHLKNLIPALLIILLLISGYRQWYKRKINIQETFGLHILLIIVIISLSTITQKLLFNTDYLVDRTAVIYYPLLALAIITLFSLEFPKTDRLYKVLFPMLTVVLVLHFSKVHRSDYFREWFFDFDTKRAMFYINELADGKEKVKVGTHWSLNQAANFYIKTNSVLNIERIKWDKKTVTDERYDYHFVPFEFEKLVHSNYELVKRYKWHSLYEHRRMR